MLSSVIIALACFALFFYWFRNVCLLILAQSNRPKAETFASLSGLHFPEVDAVLRAGPGAPDLDKLYQRLEDDYQTLSPLLSNLKNYEVDYRIFADLLRQTLDGSQMTRRLITVDFQVMRIWYKLNRVRHNDRQANQALSEMRSIIAYFAGVVGCGTPA